MVLPAFITRSASGELDEEAGDLGAGVDQAEDEEAPHSVRRHAEPSLPPSERGMLIFVGFLLALGMIGMVAMFGVGAIAHGARPRSVPVPASASPTPTPSPSPAPSPSSSPSAPASPPPSALPSTTAATGAVFVGKPDPAAYCQAQNNGTPDFVSPGTWVCRHNATTKPFTPADVCHSQYGAGTYVMYSHLSNPATWKCYRQ
jgi:hypothetical protein